MSRTHVDYWENDDNDIRKSTMSWIGTEWHKIVVGLIGLDTLWDRGVKLYDKVKSTEEFIERRHSERRHMNIREFPQFVKDVVQLANDVKVAESVISPQFPQLVADAEKLKADAERLLGINDIAAPMAPPPQAAA